MHQEITIDFSEINNYSEFYSTLRKKIEFLKYFGDNLDALYDLLSGGVEMPSKIRFIHLDVDKLRKFSYLLEMMKIAEQDIKGFTFRMNRERGEKWGTRQ